MPKKSTKSDTEMYDKVSQREHILLRPDTYIGDIEATVDKMWIYNDEKIVENTITYIPGLFKCFDELLVNARDASVNDSSCNTIKINYNMDEGFISVYNNGDIGIPVEEHTIHKTLVPTMIFGELLTSSNYDDTEARTTGGRNGYGAKLANIFSSKFIVEIDDAKRKKRYKQIWTKNMEIIETPIIVPLPAKTKSSVMITFYPDFDKFKIKNLDETHLNLFHKRTIDLAGTSNSKLNVYYNDVKILCNIFKSYIELYNLDSTIYYDNNNDNWTVGVIYKQNNDFENKNISFVNSISTYKGGSHCNHVVDNIIKNIINNYIKKKDVKISPSMLKEHLIFFINCTIVNPSFASQTKDTLTTKVDKFGSKYEPTELFIKKISKCGIIEQVIEIAKLKENANLKKTDGKKQIKIVGIPKLEDANKAGSKDAHKCTLILTEGDSAKATAMAGLGVIGRDYYGVFPLKGKLLNVRDAPVSKILENEEIKNLKIILGLKQNLDYSDKTNLNTLRYGQVLILTDQDVDGSHIKGLFINFIHSQWIELAKQNGFIQSLSTPIVKATHGKDTMIFYNMTEYSQWKEEKDTINWKIKYYKGLGTSTSLEARTYFEDINSKLIKYHWNDETDNDAIILAFEKSKSDDRKKWLMEYNKNNILTYDKKLILYNDFIHKDLIHFSNEDLIRSIPSIIDGLKPSQRKVLYGSILKGLDKEEIKVSQLSGYISCLGYHHGEASLNACIIGMAQNYVGSNNINLLYPSGQFGCLDPATPILMWDGTIKYAYEIQVNDKLIGDDGTDRDVIAITEGFDNMYEINNNKGLHFTCNSEHILTLFFNDNNNIYLYNNFYKLSYFDGTTIKNIKRKFNELNKQTIYNNLLNIQTHNEDKYKFKYIIDIKIKDYLKLSDSNKNKLKMFVNMNHIIWENKVVPIDPYILGAWLGGNENHFNSLFIDNNLYNYNKHIPINYIINDVNTRLQLLAGFIDNHKCIITSNKITLSKKIDLYLLDSLIFLSKTLGYSIHNTNKNIFIYGNIYEIPTKNNNDIIFIKNVLRNNLHSFDIKFVGNKKFNGWQVNKNERFLLGNFIVTHNSRLLGGDDNASPRYIFTKLEDLTTIIFNKLDDPILIKQFEEGQPIESEYYVPIIPMVLVNSVKGIATGFSTNIPPYNPLDIINNLRIIINDDKNPELIEMIPWWRNFKGRVVKIDNNNYEIYGEYKIINNKLIITELPVGVWTSTYKEYLEQILNNPKLSLKIPLISYQDSNTDTKIHFELTFEEGYLNNDFDKDLHLCKKLSTTNIHLYSNEGRIKKYENAEEIIIDYYKVRLEFYKKRKTYVLNELDKELQFISYKVKFLLLIVKEKLIINNKKKNELENELEKLEFKKLGNNNSYDYLLNMCIYNLTFEKIEELKNKKKEIQIEYNELENKSVKTIWLEELDKLESKYIKWLEYSNIDNIKKKNKI
jgi:DNA gyrase/topoisomerase IV subunit B